METHRRSIVKAASYRLVATSLVFAIALLYYLWERLWSNVAWGRTAT